MSSIRETFQEHYRKMGQPSKSEAEVDAEMRGREMAADPMREFFREKERQRLGAAKEKPTYKGPWPPNRYNIRPGYRWDGVDRSNGHEKRLLQEQTDKKAREEEEYRWATRDL